MFRIALDDRLDEGGFPHARRTDNSDNGGRRLGWEAVNLGNMEAFLFDLASLSMEINKKKELLPRHTSWEREACFCNLPGLA